MKMTLLVVGRTVEQHFITAINDYIQRTQRYLSFDMEVIPELKNTKSLSADVQKEKEGELILKALQPGDVVVLLDEGDLVGIAAGISTGIGACIRTGGSTAAGSQTQSHGTGKQHSEKSLLCHFLFPP